MTYKSILTSWDGDEGSKAAIYAACDLVEKNDGHLNCLCLGVNSLQPGFYHSGATPDLLRESFEKAKEDAISLETEASGFLKDQNINWSCQAVTAQIDGISSSIGLIAQFNDLVVLPQPYGRDHSDEHANILEAALFEGHAPVLVLPLGQAKPFGKKIVVAWNQSPEALSAIKAALPMLKTADLVNITVVDPRSNGAHGAEPGIELGKMLSRHGVEVEISILARGGHRIHDIIDRHAIEIGADMIVMGAYGHSRFRESILGGSTRDTLESIKMPVLMAH